MIQPKRHAPFGLLLLLCFLHLRGEAAPLTDTVDSYFALRIYNGTEDTLFVEHQRYYGLFTRDTCSEENYGTRILGNTACWRRIHQNYSPRFWALAGPSPDNLIGPVVEEVDAINSAAFAAHQMGGDTIEIDSIYLIDRSVFLLSGNTYLGTTDSSGFRRKMPPYTVLTDTARVGDERILVNTNAGFRTNHKINIADGQAFDELAGHVSYTASISLLLGGDSTIFLSGRDIQREMLPGDSVSLFFPMMTPRFTDLDSVYLLNLVFDGNRDAYHLNYDWRTNATIQLTTTNEALVENCRFYNIPTENVFLCGAVFKDCSGLGLNGSLVHFSCNDFDHPTAVLYNHFTNTNEVGNAIMNHSEAGMTFSAKVQNLRVAYNEVQQIGEYGIGIFKNDDSFNEITDNLLASDLETIAFQLAYLYPETNLIYNNKNPNFANTSNQSCWVTPPQLADIQPCRGNASLGQPLQLGDTVNIRFDAVQLRNSNENYLKAIVPIYEQDFFVLDTITLMTTGQSVYHDWFFTETAAAEKALVFDNGHRDGIYANGNWGYEPCSFDEGCTDLSFRFIVSQLPDTTSQVACPLQRIDFKYDGELGTWNEPPYCANEAIIPDPISLGLPTVIGDDSTAAANLQEGLEIDIFPNPVQDKIYLIADKLAISSYQIVDLFGRVLQKGEFINAAIIVNDLETGMYYLRLYSKNETLVKPFIKA